MAFPRFLPFTFSLPVGVVATTIVIGLFGGASRGDVATNSVVQLAGVVLIFMGMVSGCWLAISRDMRWWIGLALALTIWIAVQLVPLPPTIWTALPGRAPYVAEAAMVGVSQPWRPISLSPMNSWLALTGMTVPIGLLVGWGNLGSDQIRVGRLILAGIVAISILLGLAQISGGLGGGLYVFDKSVTGFPSGLFANRNHQGTALALVFPLLGAAIIEAQMRCRSTTTAAIVSGIVASLILPMLLVNGSRAGLLVAGVALLLSVIMVATYRLPGRPRATLRGWLLIASMAAIPLLVAGVTVLMGRAAAIERLLRLKVEDDQRYSEAATVIDMIVAHFPIGAGYGSFPQIFRVYEPFDSLRLTYFNHAHNDLLELALEGGAPSILLAFAALLLFVRQTWSVWRTSDRGRSVLYARAASLMIVTVVLASLGDYPLRTPTILVFVAIALAWLSAGATHLKTGRASL